MTEEKLREEMDKAIKQSFDVNVIINFQFDLFQKAFEKVIHLE